MSDVKHLHFSAAQSIPEIKKAVRNAANELLREFYDEISGKMRTSEGKADITKMSKNEEDMFIRRVTGYAYAIIDSYGTGSFMDDNDEVFEEYRKSDVFNPARKGREMVGRPKGAYTDIFGEKRQSTGKREGKPVEPYFKPMIPSYAFQRAEIWLFQGERIDEVLFKHLKKVVFKWEYY